MRMGTPSNASPKRQASVARLQQVVVALRQRHEGHHVDGALARVRRRRAPPANRLYQTRRARRPAWPPATSFEPTILTDDRAYAGSANVSTTHARRGPRGRARGSGRDARGAGGDVDGRGEEPRCIPLIGAVQLLQPQWQSSFAHSCVAQSYRVWLRDDGRAQRSRTKL